MSILEALDRHEGGGHMTRGLSTVGFILLVTLAAEAQQPPALTPRTAHTLSAPADVAAPAASLSDVRWLEGHWSGTGLGGVCEEVWGRPTAGAMMGMFR